MYYNCYYSYGLAHGSYNFLYSIVPQVIIVTDPPTPPYPAAMWIRLRCDVVPSLSVSYNWTGYCINHGSNQTVFRHTNYNDTLFVRSTPNVCLNIVVCSVVDSVGNTGEGIWRITNVTGKKPCTVNLHMLSQLLAACSEFILSFFCT